jgi:aspartate kinase
MKIFKFGGASVKDAAGVRNLADIVRTQAQRAVIVVSAMGKTTNALERIVRAYVDQRPADLKSELRALRTYHETIMSELAGDFSAVEQTMAGLENLLTQAPTAPFDETYDQIVSLGEVISTQIVSAY